MEVPHYPHMGRHNLPHPLHLINFSEIEGIIVMSLQRNVLVLILAAVVWTSSNRSIVVERLRQQLTRPLPMRLCRHSNSSRIRSQNKYGRETLQLSSSNSIFSSLQEEVLLLEHIHSYLYSLVQAYWENMVAIKIRLGQLLMELNQMLFLGLVLQLWSNKNHSRMHESHKVALVLGRHKVKVSGRIRIETRIRIELHPLLIIEVRVQVRVRGTLGVNNLTNGEVRILIRTHKVRVRIETKVRLSKTLEIDQNQVTDQALGLGEIGLSQGLERIDQIQDLVVIDPILGLGVLGALVISNRNSRKFRMCNSLDRHLGHIRQIIKVEISQVSLVVT